GGLTLVIALPQLSFVGILLGLGMCAVAWIELRGARDLAALDERACTRLAYNQVFFGSILFLYAVYSLWSIWHDPGPYAQEIAQMPEAAPMLGSINDLTKAIGVILYGTLLAV